jgi:tRNA A37 threonylcarbamoyladenosine synthetase subunit TsaC/SUA5/YrdC
VSKQPETADQAQLRERLPHLLRLALRGTMVTTREGDPCVIVDVKDDGSVELLREGPRKREGTFLAHPGDVELYC